MRARWAWPARCAWVLASAMFVILWPKDYGVTAHEWYWRTAALIALVYRAVFIGWCACLLLVRPFLLIRTGDNEGAPLLSGPEAFRAIFRRTA